MSQDNTPHPFAFSPGEGMGKVRLRMTRSQVRERIFRPTDIAQEGDEPDEVVLWHHAKELLDLRFQMPLDELIDLRCIHRRLRLFGERVWNMEADAFVAHAKANDLGDPVVDDASICWPDLGFEAQLEDGRVAALRTWCDATPFQPEVVFGAERVDSGEYQPPEDL